MSRPYRWGWRTVGPNLVSYIDDVRTVCRNVRRFWPVLKRFQVWDEYGLLLFMEIATKSMADCHRRHGQLVRSERTSQQLATVSELCKRLNADEYFEKAGYEWSTWQTRPDHERSKIARHAGYMEKQDAAYLGRMFRHINHWWD